MLYWSLHHAKDIQKLEGVQGRATMMVMFSIDKRRHREKLIECFKMLREFTDMDASKLFSIDNRSRTRSNGVKIWSKLVLQLDCTKFFFTNIVVWEWNKLPPSVANCNTIFF